MDLDRGAGGCGFPQKDDGHWTTGFYQSKVGFFEAANALLTTKNQKMATKLSLLEAKEFKEDSQTRDLVSKRAHLDHNLQYKETKISEIAAKRKALMAQIEKENSENACFKKRIEKSDTEIRSLNASISQKIELLCENRAKLEGTESLKQTLKSQQPGDLQILIAVSADLKKASEDHQNAQANLQAAKNDLDAARQASASLQGTLARFNRFKNEFSELRLKYYEEVNQRIVSNLQKLNQSTNVSS